MGDGNGSHLTVDRERQTFGLIVLPVWPHGDNIPEEAAPEGKTLTALQSVHLEQKNSLEIDALHRMGLTPFWAHPITDDDIFFPLM